MLEHIKIGKRDRIIDAEYIRKALRDKGFRGLLKRIVFCTTSIVRKYNPEDFDKADRAMVNFLDLLEQQGMEVERQKLLQFALAVEERKALDGIRLYV